MFFELIKMKILRTFWQNFVNFGPFLPTFQSAQNLNFIDLCGMYFHSLAIENFKAAIKNL